MTQKEKLDKLKVRMLSQWMTSVRTYGTSSIVTFFLVFDVVEEQKWSEFKIADLVNLLPFSRRKMGVDLWCIQHGCGIKPLIKGTQRHHYVINPAIIEYLADKLNLDILKGDQGDGQGPAWSLNP